MNDKIKVSLRFPRTLFGSEQYSVVFEVTNIGNKALSEIAVKPLLIPGIPLNRKELPSSTEFDKLQNQKMKLLKEMEEQIAEALERESKKKMGRTEVLIRDLFKMFQEISIFVPILPFKVKISKDDPIPYWAIEATRINEWDDVERLELVVMANETEESFLLKSFLVNKDKLKRVLTKISDKVVVPENKLKLNSITLQPGETISFTFRYRAPHIYRQRSYDCQFNVSYLDEEIQVMGNHSVGDTLTFYSSPFSVPLGSALGALVGFGVKNTFISPVAWLSKEFWTNLFGSMLLAIIFAFITARSPQTKKSFTVEDFTGGFIIGAICGLFSERVISYIGSVVPK
ncbi:hypothetical protein [Desulfosporosinus sp. OT]|uniref:hypothetical protein n=1 Tax=Desulfosporosinus sp. OT TaxID=913865 RepID=UPI000223A91D|nr:hypothetical protein [Desulfosporosinus sp. OT]EGW39087.1 hypothetical protein DOT_3038 [Desulfosporosinus sp. OT]